ncbi:MAG: hypothetical protein ABIO49_00780 [Dokdonella sp.]
MPNRLIHLLLLAASLYASGAAVVALSNGTPVSRHVETTTAKMPAVPPAAATLDATTTLLPIVVVHPEPEVLTLATVTVRPSRTDLTETVADSDEIPMATILPGVRRSTVPSFASAGFDMPYYSFGRTLRHVSKE